MKNNFLKILPATALLFFIVPQIAFAAWWNPLSWNVWSVVEGMLVGNPRTQFITVATTTQTTSTPSKGFNPAALGATPVVSPKTGTTSAIKKQINAPKTTAVIVPPVSQKSIGNVVQPAQVQTPVIPTVSSSQLQDGLAQFYAQYSLASVESGIPQLLSILSDAQTYYSDITQERTSCVSTYNSQVTYFQQQGQDALNQYTAQSKGLVSPYAISNIKAQTQMQLNDLQTTENACLASHPTNSSLSGQISQLIGQLNQLESQVQANPTSLSDIASILQNYNSLQGQVLAINSSMQSPMSVPSQAPSSAFFNCSSQGGQFICNGAGVSTNCSSVTAGSLNCVSTSGQNISCSVSGGTVACASY